MSFQPPNRDKYPCSKHPGGCPNRAPGCQSRCIEMLCAELEADERKKIDKRNRLKESELNYIAVRSSKRMRHKKAREC